MCLELNEADRVRHGFQPGNFQSLRDLPNNLTAGNVSLIAKAKAEASLFNSQEERSYIELQKGGGYFSKFEWKNDPYELFQESETAHRLAARKKTEESHNEKFVSHPNQGHRYKHQFVF